MGRGDVYLPQKPHGKRLNNTTARAYLKPSFTSPLLMSHWLKHMHGEAMWAGKHMPPVEGWGALLAFKFNLFDMKVELLSCSLLWLSPSLNSLANFLYFSIKQWHLLSCCSGLCSLAFTSSSQWDNWVIKAEALPVTPRPYIIVVQRRSTVGGWFYKDWSGIFFPICLRRSLQ